MMIYLGFFFKQKTAYEMRISDWSSDVCSSDLQFPYQTPVALQYDIGDYDQSMDKALEMIDYKGFAKPRKASDAKGKLRGIGISAYIQACGIAPSAVVGPLGAGVGLWESAQVRFSPTGPVPIFTGLSEEPPTALQSLMRHP